jgi:PBP1b-binding outer membrane lipoprotein LpoB
MRIILLIVLGVFVLSGCSKQMSPNPTLSIAKEILKHQYNKKIKEVTYEKKW